MNATRDDNRMLIDCATRGDLEDVKSLLSLILFDQKILTKAYYVAKKRSIKLKHHGHITDDELTQIKLHRYIVLQSLKPDQNIDETLIDQGLKAEACANELQPYLTNYDLVAYYLCQLNHNLFYPYVTNNPVDFAFKHKGKTMLHVACKTNNITIVQYLLKYIHVNTQELSLPFQTPLHIAVRYHHVDLVKLLLTYKPKMIRDGWGKMPMHHVEPGPDGHPTIFSLLIHGGADINDKIDDKTLLYKAVRANRLETVKYLLDLKASPYMPSLNLANFKPSIIGPIFEKCFETPIQLANRQIFEFDEDAVTNYRIILLLDNHLHYHL